MLKFLLVLCLSINVSYAAAGKLAEAMISSSEFSKLLTKFGIKGRDAEEFTKGVNLSLESFKDKKVITKYDLSKALGDLKVTEPDYQAKRAALVKLLNSPTDQIKKEDFVSAVNNLISIASRYGKSAMFACSKCVSDSEAAHGLVLGVSEVKNATTAKLLKNEIPNSPEQLKGYISSRMKRLGMGDYGSNVTPKTVSKEDEKYLAIYLGLTEKGSKEQKALATAIKNLSTKNGKTQLIDPKASHKLWRVMAEDMSDDNLKAWTQLITEVKARADKDGVSPQEAWNRTFKDKAQGDAELTRHYNDLKKKNCYFI